MACAKAASLARAGLLCTSLAIPAQGRAAELGQIIGFVDGARAVWHTVTHRQQGRQVATATVRFGPRLTDVQIQGHMEPRFTVEGVFSLDVQYLGRAEPGAQPMSADILMMPRGMGGPFWTTRGVAQKPRVDLLVLDAWGSVGRVEAVFEARLCLRPTLSAPTDTGTCRHVSGAVQTQVFVE